jgi:hypothetical protein
MCDALVVCVHPMLMAKSTGPDSRAYLLNAPSLGTDCNGVESYKG